MGQTKRKLRQQRRLMRIGRVTRAQEIADLLIDGIKPTKPKMCHKCNLLAHTGDCREVEYWLNYLRTAMSSEYYEEKETKYLVRLVLLGALRASEFKKKGHRRKMDAKWQHTNYEAKKLLALKEIKQS